MSLVTEGQSHFVGFALDPYYNVFLCQVELSLEACHRKKIAFLISLLFSAAGILQGYLLYILVAVLFLNVSILFRL